MLFTLLSVWTKSIKHFYCWRPQIGIIVLSMHDNELYTARVLNCGALGYINKQDSAQKRRKNLSQTLTSKNAINIQMLTDRELQVFETIGQYITTYAALRINIITLQQHNNYDSRETELIFFVYGNNLTHYM